MKLDATILYLLMIVVFMMFSAILLVLGRRLGSKPCARLAATAGLFAAVGTTMDIYRDTAPTLLTASASIVHIVGILPVAAAVTVRHGHRFPLRVAIGIAAAAIAAVVARVVFDLDDEVRIAVVHLACAAILSLVIPLQGRRRGGLERVIYMWLLFGIASYVLRGASPLFIADVDATASGVLGVYNVAQYLSLALTGTVYFGLMIVAIVDDHYSGLSAERRRTAALTG